MENRGGVALKYYLLDSEGRQLESFTAPKEGAQLLPEAPDEDHRWTGIAWMADMEKVAAKARAERDRLLSSCDWTQVADAPVDKAAWAAYRQVLRDWPQSPGFPDMASLPVEP
jgi:hypothetical protein